MDHLIESDVVVNIQCVTTILLTHEQVLFVVSLTRLQTDFVTEYTIGHADRMS